MSEQAKHAQDESAVLSADKTGADEFFIDDYSHLRLSYYQYRDDMSLDVSDSAYQDSAYSTNASTNESFRENNHEENTSNSDAGNSTNATDFKDPNEEERRKLREFYISQIPDLPHPSYTVASIISSASHKMDPKNRFVYNDRVEQGTARVKGDKETFVPERRSTLKPDTKL